MSRTLIKTRKYLKEKPIEEYIPSPQAMESINKSFDLKGERLMGTLLFYIYKNKIENSLVFKKTHIVQ